MLLKALYDLALERRLLDTEHLERRSVHILVPLTSEGALAAEGVIPLTAADEKGKTGLGKRLVMTRFPGENNGGKAYFLAESCAYILGIETPSGRGLALPGERESLSDRSFDQLRSYFHFWDQIKTARESTGLSELDALVRFKQRYLGENSGRVIHRLPFVELRELEKKRKGDALEVCARSVTGEWIPLKGLIITFQVDGNLVFSGEPEAPLTQYWKKTYRYHAYASERSQNQSEPIPRGLCLVTGRTDTFPAGSHKPKIKRVPGVSPGGGYLIAVDGTAFYSYGRTGNSNSPVSEEAAAAYALGLQSLLDNENHSLKIGPTVVCFWARQDERQADFIGSMLRKADPKAVADFLKSPWAGVDRELAGKDRFYSVTLSGNAGRIVVRHWMQITVAQARENLREWFSDLEIVSLWPQVTDTEKRKAKSADSSGGTNEKEGRNPLAVQGLALATVRESKSKDLRNEVVAQLYRAALEGTAPSVLLLKAILHEFKVALVTDSSAKPRFPFSPSRFALLRLVLNRNRKESDAVIEPQVFETHDAAYNCGRLLAVLAAAQDQAHQFALEGPGIAERYFGTASASPALVFPLLLRLNRHHLAKISIGSALYMERRIQNIIAHFTSAASGQPPEFPRHLSLQAQGRFAIGFYQEKAAADAQRRRDRQDPQDQSATTEEVSK